MPGTRALNNNATPIRVASTNNPRMRPDVVLQNKMEARTAERVLAALRLDLDRRAVRGCPPNLLDLAIRDGNAAVRPVELTVR